MARVATAQEAAAAHVVAAQAAAAKEAVSAQLRDAAFGGDTEMAIAALAAGADLEAKDKVEWGDMGRATWGGGPSILSFA